MKRKPTKAEAEYHRVLENLITVTDALVAHVANGRMDEAGKILREQFLEPRTSAFYLGLYRDRVAKRSKATIEMEERFRVSLATLGAFNDKMGVNHATA